MMTESNFKHEYLFVLGNGASIASANPEIKKFIKTTPSIKGFIDVMKEIKKERQEPDCRRQLDECVVDHSYNQIVKRIIEISEEKRETDISKLFTLLMKNRNCDNDIIKLINAVYITVISYYKNYCDEYFLKLWEIVRKTKSPVVSLNWDINFERTIHKDLKKKIPMKNYYGECVFGHLFPDEPKQLYNPVVEILKPHGSLNWHFNAQFKPRINYGLRIPDHVLNGTWNDEDLRDCFLIPPLPDREILYWGHFTKHIENIRSDMDSRIIKYAASTHTLVIIGYSFPDDDEHIKKLFADNRFEKVLVFDTDEKVFQRIKGYFPQAKHEFKKGGFADILDWPDVGEGFEPSRSE